MTSGFSGINNVVFYIPVDGTESNNGLGIPQVLVAENS